MNGLNLILICERVEEKIIQDQQFDTTQVLLTTAELLFVRPLEEHETVHQFLRAEVFYPVS